MKIYQVYISGQGHGLQFFSRVPLCKLSWNSHPLSLKNLDNLHNLYLQCTEFNYNTSQ